MTVIADHSVVAAGLLVAGANQEGYHLRNVVYGRDWQATQTADIASVRTDDPCPRCSAPLTLERGIEIGYIAKLGTRYTEALGATYRNPQGVVQPLVMGSYGIAIERLIQVIVEQHHDEAGIVWPATVAPADVELVRLGKKEQISRAADELYTQLRSAGVRVLYDDRDESAGVKFNDADLIGLPVRLLISERLLATDSVEIKPRAGTAVQVYRTEVLAAVRTMLAERPSD